MPEYRIMQIGHIWGVGEGKARQSPHRVRHKHIITTSRRHYVLTGAISTSTDPAPSVNMQSHTIEVRESSDEAAPVAVVPALEPRFIVGRSVKNACHVLLGAVGLALEPRVNVAVAVNMLWSTGVLETVSSFLELATSC